MASISTTAALRKLINAILRTPADVDALCLDHFPSVRKRFTAEMDGVARVSLLLTHGDPDEIVTRLRCDYADAFERNKHLLPVEAQQEKQAGRSCVPSVTLARPLLPQVQVAPTERPTLTVHFDKTTAGKLTVRYSLPDDDKQIQVGPLDWESIWSQTTLAGRTGLPALRDALTSANQTELAPWLTSIGDTLFQILFPLREVQDQVLTRLFRKPHPSPSRDRLRVRILTTDSELSALPWALTAWDHRPLAESGWSFELVTQDLPEKRAVLQSPVRVLVMAPQSQSAEERQHHLTDLVALLGHPDPEFFQVVQSRSELLRVTPSFPADVVYFLGTGHMKQGQVALMLDGGEPLSLSELRQALRGHFPQVLFLLGGPNEMDPLWLSAPRSLLPEIPLIVVGRGGPYQPCAPMLAIQFLKQFLGDRLDPALALSQLASPLEIPESVARSAFVSYTAYDSIEVRPLLLQRKNPRSHLRLDRTLARAAVIEQVSRLVRSKSRRVESLIAHADAGNLLSHFAEQAVDHIERNGLAPVKRVQLDFPIERSDLHRSLEQTFLLQLDGIGKPLPSVLLQHAPRTRGQASARVLWLDWKRFGGPEGQPPLKKHELDAWLRFGFDTLVHACPHDVRIVSYLAMHVEEKNQKRLRDDLELVKQKLISDQFRAFLLPALPRVDHSELVEFLTEPDNTTCPPSLATQIADLIYRDTGGIYDQAVRHIEAAEQSGWGSLYTELSRRHGLVSPPSHDDEAY